MADAYPFIPGHRGADTSIAAAEAITPVTATLQKLAYAAIANAGPQGITTNELAQRLGFDRSSIQPRTSELRRQQRIVDSGLRRRNANGKRAIVWTLPNFAHDRGEPA